MGTRKKFLDRENDQNVLSGDSHFAVPADSCTHGQARRVFLTTCSTSLAAVASQWLATRPCFAAVAEAENRIQRYASSILTDEHGQPVRASSIKPLVNYLFHYPFVATPCLLLNLGRDVGGVGAGKAIVAYSAICSHKLAYPAKEVSFIRFQAKASTRSEAERIHCCADHSVYDPAASAKVVAGPAPSPLAAIKLLHNEHDDTLRAIGTSGVEQFAAFFAKYDFKLSLEFGDKARDRVTNATRLQELTQFCRNVAQC